jgi:hypothetical protein
MRCQVHRFGCGIPLSNTNQIWGLTWGLVFREMAGKDTLTRAFILTGSIVMAGGAWAVSSAEAPDSERSGWRRAVERECQRYGLQQERLIASLEGGEALKYPRPERPSLRRNKWDLALLLGGIGIFAWLAMTARRQSIIVNRVSMAVLITATFGFLVGGSSALASHSFFLEFCWLGTQRPAH